MKTIIIIIIRTQIIPEYDATAIVDAFVSLSLSVSSSFSLN